MKQLLLVLFVSFPLAAADPPGFAHLTSHQMRGYETTLAPKINPQKVATDRLADWGNHLLMVAHRQGSGESELHEAHVDLFIVQSGEATLVVGGKIVDGRTAAPGEIRGRAIEGGEKKKLGPGDIVHIPARTAHQLLLEPGRQFTYAICKIDSK